MCCEQDECVLAVFNEVEAVCYLKGEGADNSANSVAAEGVSTYTIERRIGESIIATIAAAPPPPIAFTTAPTFTTTTAPLILLLLLLLPLLLPPVLCLYYCSYCY